MAHVHSWFSTAKRKREWCSIFLLSFCQNERSVGHHEVNVSYINKYFLSFTRVIQFAQWATKNISILFFSFAYFFSRYIWCVSFLRRIKMIHSFEQSLNSTSDAQVTPVCYNRQIVFINSEHYQWFRVFHC